MCRAVVPLARAATIAVKNVKSGVLKLIVVVDIRNARQRHDVGGRLRSVREEINGIHRSNASGTFTSDEA